jgi:hypothetical protein
VLAFSWRGSLIIVSVARFIGVVMWVTFFQDDPQGRSLKTAALTHAAGDARISSQPQELGTVRLRCIPFRRRGYCGEADGGTSRTGVIISGFLGSCACHVAGLYIHDLQTIGTVSIWCLLFRRADGSANLGDPYGYSAKQRWRT